MVKTMTEALTFAAGLVFGTASSIISKELFSLQVDYEDGSGDKKNFEKPLFQTTMMFLGMSFALPIHYFFQWRAKSAAAVSSEGYQAFEDDPEEFHLTFRICRFLLIPATFDLVATALANIGLMLINVSIYQLMKCSVIIFVAFLKTTALGERLPRYAWFGVLLNMIAVTLVASTQFLPSADSDSGGDDGGDGKSDSSAAGLFFVVMSCVVQSGQYVFEEKVMSSSDDSAVIPPLVVVGLEGTWGLVLSLVLVLPVASFLPGKDCPLSLGPNCDHPVYENTGDTLKMFGQSGMIVTFTVIYVLVITGYNAACIFVTFLLDAVWHAILDNFRPVAVWMTQLALWQITKGSFGEEWQTSSWLELGGMFMLLYGTGVYNANIRLSCFQYDDAAAEVVTEYAPMASPMLQSATVDARRRQSAASVYSLI